MWRVISRMIRRVIRRVMRRVIRRVMRRVMWRDSRVWDVVRHVSTFRSVMSLHSLAPENAMRRERCFRAKRL
jgi:hypothetical protein